MSNPGVNARTLTRFRNHRLGAFTLIELLIVIAEIAILGGILLPALARQQMRSKRIPCVSHLKNIGLAFRIAAVDEGAYIWGVPTNRGGVDPVNFGKSNWLFLHALSNELSTPKILACPSDDRRSRSNTWSCVALVDHDGALSYFLGPSALEDQPQSILAGDRNITNLVNNQPADPDGLTSVSDSLLTLKKADGMKVGLADGTAGPAYTSKIHNGAGNLLLGDGSVQQVNSGRLREQLRYAANAVGDQKFAFPLKQ